MKILVKPYFISWLFTCLLTLLMFSCDDDDSKIVVEVIDPGIAKASYHEALFTRISDLEVRDELYVRIGVFFENDSEYSNYGIYKMLLDGNGQEISRAVAIENIKPEEYTNLVIETGQSLFDGFGISQNEIQADHSFKFVRFKSKEGGEPELFEDFYELMPDYNVLEFEVSYDDSSTRDIAYTRTYDEKVQGEIDVNLIFTIDAEANDEEEFTNIGVIKHFYDEDGVEIDTTIAASGLSLKTPINISYTDINSLFDGIDYDYNKDLDGAHHFQFTVFAETANNETVVMDDLFTTVATYQVELLPVLETGVWIVENTDSGLTKEIEVLEYSPGVYFFTDFGLDWSWWNDYWYGVTFEFESPTVDGDPYLINIGVESGSTNDTYTQLADDGVTMESRRLRLMGYTYQDGSPKGTYDENTGAITFTNVNIKDSWWDIDNHNNVNMTFTKKP